MYVFIFYSIVVIGAIIILLMAYTQLALILSDTEPSRYDRSGAFYNRYNKDEDD